MHFIFWQILDWFGFFFPCFGFVGVFVLFCSCLFICISLVCFFLKKKLLGRWKCSSQINTTFWCDFDIHFQLSIFKFSFRGSLKLLWIHTLIFEFQKCFQSFWILSIYLPTHELMIAKYLLLQVLKSVIEISLIVYSYKKTT